jgi:hypothetical protein
VAMRLAYLTTAYRGQPHLHPSRDPRARAAGHECAALGARADQPARGSARLSPSSPAEVLLAQPTAIAAAVLRNLPRAARPLRARSPPRSR